MQCADDERHDISTTTLTASIKAHGAELCGLRDSAGHDYLWPAIAPWQRHAPVLFPIVGRLKDDILLHRGERYRMTQHGFARDRVFEWVERSDTLCRLALSDDAQSRAIYPFAFRFEVTYVIVGSSLAITFEIMNTGDEVLPASMGAHPAFRWPIVPGIAKEAHSLRFAAAEPAPLRGVAGGLLTAAVRPSPIEGSTLPLAPELFARDALILEEPASRSVLYSAPGTPELTVRWKDFDQLGIWSRADADLLCIEPWCGMASPVEFDGEFIDKPWLHLIPPGGTTSATHWIEISPPAG